MKRGYTQSGYQYLEIAPGSRFYSTRYYCEVMNLTPRVFSELCERLDVPFVYLGNAAYVKYEALVCALDFVGGIGQPDFWGPGTCNMVENPKRTRASTHYLDRDEYLKCEDRVIRSIEMGLKIHGKKLDQKHELQLRNTYRKFKNSALLVLDAVESGDDAESALKT